MAAGGPGLRGVLLLSFAVLVAILVGLLATRGPSSSPAEQALLGLGLAIALPAEAELLRQGADGPRTELLVALGEDQLRVRMTPGLGPMEAQRRADDILAVITNLFGDRQAPYPGQLSHTLQCPPEFQPEALPAPENAFAVRGLYANDRLAYGGCSADLLRYRSTLAVFYDADAERLFELESFGSLDGGAAAAQERGMELVGRVRFAEGAH